jgi:hypothetical protein
LNRQHDGKTGRFVKKAASTAHDDHEANHETAIQPANGLFGALDEQARMVFQEIYDKRVKLLNEFATIEQEVNRQMEEHWIPRAQARLGNYKDMAKEQGFEGEE